MKILLWALILKLICAPTAKTDNNMTITNINTTIFMEMNTTQQSLVIPTSNTTRNATKENLPFGETSEQILPNTTTVSNLSPAQKNVSTTPSSYDNSNFSVVSTSANAFLNSSDKNNQSVQQSTVLESSSRLNTTALKIPTTTTVVEAPTSTPLITTVQSRTTTAKKFTDKMSPTTEEDSILITQTLYIADNSFDEVSTKHGSSTLSTLKSTNFEQTVEITTQSSTVKPISTDSKLGSTTPVLSTNEYPSYSTSKKTLMDLITTSFEKKVSDLRTTNAPTSTKSIPKEITTKGSQQLTTEFAQTKKRENRPSTRGPKIIIPRKKPSVVVSKPTYILIFIILSALIFVCVVFFIVCQLQKRKRRQTTKHFRDGQDDKVDNNGVKLNKITSKSSDPSQVPFLEPTDDWSYIDEKN